MNKQSLENYSFSFDLGYLAFLNGKYLDDNPFNLNKEPINHKGYVDGFRHSEGKAMIKNARRIRINNKQSTESYTLPFDLGYDAFLEGKSRSDNPFNPCTEQLLYEAWVLGWTECKNEEYDEQFEESYND